MLTDEQLEQFRQAREGPYDWRDCEICGNFVMPGEQECPNPLCVATRVAKEIGKRKAAQREEDVLAILDALRKTFNPPGPETSPSCGKLGSDSSE